MIECFSVVSRLFQILLACLYGVFVSHGDCQGEATNLRN